MRSKIKVLYILNASSKNGGANKAIVNIIDILMFKDILPYVVLPYEGGICDELNYRNIPFSVTPFTHSVYPMLSSFRDYIYFFPRIFLTIIKNRNARKNIQKIINEFTPDIIHTNVGPIDIGYKLTKKMKIPHIWHIREYQDLDFEFHPFPSKYVFKKKLRFKCNYPVAITKGIYEYFNMENNAKIIYDGVLSKNEILFNMQKENFFLFAGRLTEKKGILEVLYAFNDFLKYEKKYRLYIAGDTQDEIFKAKIIKYVKDNDLLDYIIFLGMIDNVLEYMSKATALIVPSKSEGFGFITVEAMFKGCLVIGNNNAGTKEILEKENLGVLYSTREELVISLRKIIEVGIENYFPQILKAQLNAVKLYSKESSASIVYDLYKESLQQNTNI